MLPPPTRPPTEIRSASRALIAFGSPLWFLPESTRNMRVKYSIWTKPLITVMNTPNTTRMGISAHPQVRSSIRPKKPVIRSISSKSPLGAWPLLQKCDRNAPPSSTNARPMKARLTAADDATLIPLRLTDRHKATVRD
jgi:hypothetical protein